MTDIIDSGVVEWEADKISTGITDQLWIGEHPMTNMEQYKRPGKRVIDISTWSRRSNFEFFRDFINPNLGVTVRVDVRHAYYIGSVEEISESFRGRTVDEALKRFHAVVDRHIAFGG